MSAVSRDDLKPCRTCGRRFATDRVGVHEAICAAMGQKKRRPFDPKKQRLAGTPAEQFNRVGAGKQQQKGASAKSGTSTRPQSMKKPDWRRKHEDFINTIRAAKEMKAHIAAGGKVSDLPPPPRSDYSDYINCPHCGRNFNQTAAERHIPRCATMEHNKPNRPQVIEAQKEAAAKRR